MTFNRFAGLGTLHALRTLVFARAPLGCDVSRAGNGMSAMRVLRFASAARAGSVSRPSSLWRPTKCVWMFGRRPGAPCSDTANTSVPWKESLQDTTRLYQPRRPQPRRSMRWADVYVCMLADGVALRNRCPQGQADPRAAIAGGASGVTTPVG